MITCTIDLDSFTTEEAKNAFAANLKAQKVPELVEGIVRPYRNFQETE
jgi:hypothetical protein